MLWYFIWAGVSAFACGFFAHLATFGVASGGITARQGVWFGRMVWVVFAIMMVTAFFLPVSGTMFDFMLPASVR